MSRTIIIGASVGGVRTAQELRAAGYAGEVLLVEAEAELPYDKPPLSKGLLLGTTEPERMRLLAPEQAADLDLRLGTAVTAVDTAAKRITLADGSAEAYDTLVIATGVAPSWGPWAHLKGRGGHVVRTLADSLALRDELATGGPVVVIGSGFIGAEVAASARALGVETHLVDPLPTPMARALEPAVGHLVTELHRSHGVTTHLGVGVQEVTGSRGDFGVRLTDGTALDAAVVVIGIGARPDTAWLEGSGLTLGDGIVCDQQLRAVGTQDVYAVGDVCRWTDAVTGEAIRAEHWTNAVDQARCAAHNIALPEEPIGYHAVDYVWTDQYDWKIQVVGHHQGAAGSRTFGDVDDGRFAVVYTDADGALLGAAVANWPRALLTVRKGMAAGRRLDEVAEKLAAGPGVRRRG